MRDLFFYTKKKMDILPIGTRVDIKKQLRGKKEIRNTKEERKKETLYKNKYIGAELTRKVDTISIVTRDLDDGDEVRGYIKEIHTDLLNTFTALKIKLKLVKYQSALSDNKRLKKELDDEVMSIVQEIRDSVIGSSLLDEPVLETIQADDYRRDLVNIGDYIQTYDTSLRKLEPINRAIGYLRDDIKDTKRALRQSTAYIAELGSIDEYKGAIRWLYEYIDAFATHYRDTLEDDDISVEEVDTTRVDNDDDVLSEFQRRCIDLMSAKAREFSAAVTQDDDDDDLDRRVQYVRDREVVSHQCIIKLLTGIIESNDDTIKSCFVTGTTMSGGGRLLLNKRAKAESLLFDGLFDDQPNEERPIYGAINLIDDPEGVSSCRDYNISYIVLKEPVKLRMTITEKDSMTKGVPLDIGTFLYMNHIVNTLDSDALEMYVSGYKFSPGDNDELQSDSYVEVQIHGKVRLSHDIKRFMIDPKYACNERVIQLVADFRRKFPCDLVFQVIGGEEW